GAEEEDPCVRGHVPHARAAVCGAVDRHHRHRGSADLLPCPLAGSGGRAFPDGLGKAVELNMPVLEQTPKVADTTSLISQKPSRARPLFDPPIVKRAIVDSFRKLNPRGMMKNPVMFVVEIGAVMTTVSLFHAWSGFAAQITIWLWFTVLFAN